MMNSVSRFYDLECWKHSKKLTCSIYALTIEEKLMKDFGYSNQIRRASVSIMNNIAEGFGRYSKKEFARFLNYSIGSCLEVQSMLFIGQDLGYLNKQNLTELLELSNLVKSQLISLKRVQLQKSE